MPLFPRSRAGKEKEGTHFLSVPSQTILSPDLSRAIDLARQEMDDAYLHFQNASDPDLIDCYIYKGNARMETLPVSSASGKGRDYSRILISRSVR